MNDPVIHGVVAAQFGDLEFDVGKSVRWTQWFADHIHVTDINLGTQRYWIVNWDKTFPQVKHTTTGINFFTRPAEFRKEQWRLYQQAFHVDPGDWVLWVDAHEGLSFDINSLPNDYNASPFRSWVYREVSRAEGAGKDRVVVPFYAFVRSGELQNVVILGSGSPENDVKDLAQTVSVPYYATAQGLPRLFKASVLLAPNFDWTTLDQVQNWQVAAGTGTPAIPAYLTPVTGRASTPDTTNLTINADMTWVAKIRIKSLTDATSRVIASQRAATATNMAFSLSIDNSDKLVLRVSVNGTAFTSGGGGALTGRCVPGDIVTVAASIDIDNGAAGHTITYYMLINSVWTQIGTLTTAGAIVSAFDSTAGLTVGGASATTLPYDDNIYWAEMRTGLNPAAGTLTWRCDMGDYASGTTFTSNGRTWTLSSASAITKAVAAVPAVPDVKMQIISYAYAHWQYLDMDEDGVIPPISASNDHGFQMRKQISMVRPLPEFLYSVWNEHDDLGVGLPGPWCSDMMQVTSPDFESSVVEEKGTHTPADPTMAGLMTPLYDTVFRLNLRDGVWYVAGVSGNIPMSWDSAAGEWVTNFDPALWPSQGLESWVGDPPP